MSLKGTNGVLSVFDDHIEISRENAFGKIAQGNRGARTIYYCDLTSVEYRKPTILANGYIKFIVSGTTDVDASVNYLGTTKTESLQDPNTLILRAFNKKTPIEAEQAYTTISDKIAAQKVPQTPSPSTLSVSPTDELIKYKALLDAGVLTQEEFDARKTRLLSQL